MYKEQMDVQGISIYKYIFVTKFGYVLKSKDCLLSQQW